MFDKLQGHLNHNRQSYKKTIEGQKNNMQKM